MDNNKKQQHFSGAGNSKTSNQTSDFNQKKSGDIQANKYWPRNSRRCENPTPTTRNKQQLSAKVRPNVDKRPRGRGCNSHSFGRSYRNVNEDHPPTRTGLVRGNATFCFSLETERFGHCDYEHNSVYSPGSKKQNLNHLLNFYYTPREVDCYDGVGGNYSGPNVNNTRHIPKKHKFNKEQFLQANFQFVIKASAKRKTDDSPDTLIDWSLIEQINIQAPDDPQCPICLYPPVAAKVTRCGHVYCWPCILHYLSLSDKSWRKCPLCYDAIHVADLKSASIVQLQNFKVDSQITFRLMRRKKGSLFIEIFDNKRAEHTMQKYPYVGSPIEEKLFSKFILAKRSDIADILAREQRELITDVDKTCPEYIFIQQAIELLKQRSEKLGEIEHKDEEIYKLGEIEQNIKTSVIENTEEFVKNDKKSDQVLQCDSALLSNNEQQSSFEEETSESSSNTEVIPLNENQNVKTLSTKFYYFYQSDDGQNIYLHPLNVKMLQACYGSLADAPSVIKARIIQKEQHSMDEDHRRKFSFLGHLPLTCQFAVVEIEMQPPYVTEDIIQIFKSDIQFRKNERQRKANEERKREKHINEINERQMGKIIASTANINLTSSHEFPMCGFEEALVQTGESNVIDNLPSTSKGCRSKTISTSSAGSCSYSAIALHCKKEDAPWSALNAAQLAKPSLVPADQSEVGDGEDSVLNTIRTNLGDVLAQALSQKKDKKSSKSRNETINSNLNKSVGTKKSKKCKKMLPLYSTGMNFSGN